MKIRRIDIERLDLILPRTELPGTHAGSVALARAAATNLAKALEQSGSPPTAQKIPKLNVQVARSQANPTGIARAIHASVVRFGAPAKRRQ
jgi:hypothetical protein